MIPVSAKSKYAEILNYLTEQLPMFQRQGASAYKKDLSNTLALCQIVGNPERTFPTIHVAGTNGKGSTSHMLAAVLQAHGLRVGLYTSPHYKDFRERIKINGNFIAKKFIATFVEKYKPEFEPIQASFFEWTVAMAFDYFRHEKVDVAVIEVGMGGRLDSTNVITPLVSVITNISFDHTQFLGDTLEKIAFEKAGIIKNAVPAVIGEEQPETTAVFENAAKEKNAPLFFASRNFQIQKISRDADSTIFDVFDKAGKNIYKSLKISLSGDYQAKNLGTVLQTLEVLKNRLPGWDFDENKMRIALADIQRFTKMMGRWQIISKNPLVICDSAHNEGGLSLAMEQLKLQRGTKKLHMVVGAVNDKDLSKMLALMPATATYYFCKPDIPRGLETTEMQKFAKAFGLHGKTYTSVKNALRAAKRNSGPDDLIYVGGSTFVVAEVI